MASEDSVEHLVMRYASMLAVPIEGVGELDDASQALRGSMPALSEQLDDDCEDLIVDHTRRIAHVSAEEGYDGVQKDTSIRDLENQHVLVPRLGKDRAGTKLLRSHFQEASSLPVLVKEKLRLDEVAKGRGGVPFDRHAHASFAFNEAGDKPASLLPTRQPFLLIVCSRHFVTVPPGSDGTSSAAYSDVPAYS